VVLIILHTQKECCNKPPEYDLSNADIEIDKKQKLTLTQTMKKLINTLGTLLVVLITSLYPIQQSQMMNGMCCVNCAMKKEDAIEIVVDEVQEIEA
jgi:hypothetical protein